MSTEATNTVGSIPKKLLTPEECQAYLGVGRDLYYRLLAQGLPATDLSGETRRKVIHHVDEVNEWVREVGRAQRAASRGRGGRQTEDVSAPVSPPPARKGGGRARGYKPVV